MQPCIVKLQDVSDEVKDQIVELFNEEWGNTSLQYTKKILMDTWTKKPNDVLLVMLNNPGGKLIGTIGIDHKYFFPIGSHLFVTKEFRNMGYANTLISEMEKLTNKTIYACCKPEKVPGNERRGWKKISSFGFSKLYDLVPMSKKGTKS